MVTISQDDVVLATEDVWLSVLNMAPHRSADAGPEPELSLVGVVQITGWWTGAVTIQVPSGLAGRLAGAMFRLTDREPGLDEQVDALGEITNMIGGQLKGLLDGPCQLSLPAVVAGGGYRIRMPGGRTMHEVPFDCEQHRFVVSVVSMTPDRAA